jgi:hypothetical protein
MLDEDRAFDTEWYETALRALPELPRKRVTPSPCRAGRSCKP